MNIFLGLLDDPFDRRSRRWPRVRGAASARNGPRVTNARSPTRRTASAGRRANAMPMPRCTRRRWSRRSIRPCSAGASGRRVLADSLTTDGNAALGSNTVTSRIFGGAAGRRLSLLAVYAGRRRARRRRHQFFGRERAWQRPLRPVPGRRVRAAHGRSGLCLWAHWLMAGRMSRPTAPCDGRRRPVARAASRPTRSPGGSKAAIAS